MVVVTASMLVWFTRLSQAVDEVGIQDNVVTPFPTFAFLLNLIVCGTFLFSSIVIKKFT